MAKIRPLFTSERMIAFDPLTQAGSFGPPEQVVSRTAPGLDQESGDFLESLGAFFHATDLHLIDPWSGRSFELVRNLHQVPLLASSWRPWAPFAAASLISMVRTMDEISHSPFSDRRVDLAVISGDLIENSQYNELRAVQQILNGQIVQPFLATLEIWQARLPAELAELAEVFWNLALAGKKFKRPILLAPGNHDLLGTGFMRHNLWTYLWAAQPYKFLPAKDFRIPNFEKLWGAASQGNIARRLGAWRKLVQFAPSIKRNSKLVQSKFDLDRRGVTMQDYESLVLQCGRDLNLKLAGSIYYSCRPADGVVFIVLDTISVAGGSHGHITQEQFDWLREELFQAESNEELVIVVSHHPPVSMTEKKTDPRSRRPVLLGADLLRLLSESKSVVAHLAGHTHQNSIVYRSKANAVGGGYWEIVTSGFLDFPQQFRFLELFRRRDGNLVLKTRMINHSASLEVGLGDPETCSNRELCDYCASTGRRLAYFDTTIGETSSYGALAFGQAKDRNADLTLCDPYSAATSLVVASSTV
jgi:3',5'-cyclic AMP phosphodiesterase CpdA